MIAAATALRAFQPAELRLLRDQWNMPVGRAGAGRCGFRGLMRDPAGQAFVERVIARGSADVVTAFSGGQNGLREATDALLHIMGRYGETIDRRAAYSADYQRYLAERQIVVPEIVRSSS